MAKEKKETPKRDEISARVEEAIIRAAEAAEAGEDTVVLSSGVKVKLHRLPPLLQRTVEAQFPEPEPPMVEVKVHGKKEKQPNPDDPDYIEARKQWASDRGQALMDLALIKGVEFEMPEDEDWIDELALIGVDVGEGKVGRKLAYLRSVVIGSLDDLMEVTGRVLAMSGVSPQAVDEAGKSLPD